MSFSGIGWYSDAAAAKPLWWDEPYAGPYAPPGEVLTEEEAVHLSLAHCQHELAPEQPHFFDIDPRLVPSQLPAQLAPVDKRRRQSEERKADLRTERAERIRAVVAESRQHLKAQALTCRAIESLGRAIECETSSDAREALTQQYNALRNSQGPVYRIARELGVPEQELSELSPGLERVVQALQAERVAA